MAFKLSPQAKRDLREIAIYTMNQWSPEQATRYLAEVDARFRRLAELPYSGRTCEAISLTLRRVAHGSHVIFYHTFTDGVLIVRILHRSMLPTSQTFDATEPNA